MDKHSRQAEARDGDYQPPTLEVIGSLIDLTAGGGGEPKLDSCNEGIYSYSGIV
jgi:hypothetical protein